MTNGGIKSLLEELDQPVAALGALKLQTVGAQACNLKLVGQGEAAKLTVRNRSPRNPRAGDTDKQGRQRDRYDASNLDRRHVSSLWFLSC
jgi:hypothetical protein